MCEFISAIKVKDDYFYLTKDDLKGKKFNDFKKENKEWRKDICGHGAIEYFYPDLKGKGEHWECKDFSSTDNFPLCIVEDIKKGNFNGIGVCIDILNEAGLKEYKKIKNLAWTEYEKIANPAWEEYKKIRNLAWTEYEKIKNLAFEEYENIENPALEEYEKIKNPSLEEYEKIRNKEFLKIAIQKKYRNDAWK